MKPAAFVIAAFAACVSRRMRGGIPAARVKVGLTCARTSPLGTIVRVRDPERGLKLLYGLCKHGIGELANRVAVARD